MNNIKKTAIIAVILATGCSSEVEDNRSNLSKPQRSQIEQRIQTFGVVTVLKEPKNFPGSKTSYVVAEDTVQIAAVSQISDEALIGKTKYAACSACHGAQGEGGVGPVLSGKTKGYISGRLIAYRNKEQIGSQSALMWGQAGALSDQDIEDLSAYIETLQK